MINNLKNLYQRIGIYFENTGWILIERALQILAHLLILVLLARNLGPELYGRYAYALSLVSLFAVIGHLGLGALVVRELVRAPQQTSLILGSSFALKAAAYFTGFLALVGFAFASEVAESMQFWLIVLLSFSVLFRPLEIFHFWFQAHLQSNYIAIARLMSLIVYTVITAVLVLYSAPIYAYAISYVVYVALYTISLGYLYHQRTEDPVHNWTVSKPKMKFLLSQGWLVFVSAIFAMITFKIDQVMLKWMVGTEEVGRYVIAANLIEAWTLLPNAIIVSLFPRLISLHEENKALFDHRLQQISDLMMVFAVAGVVAVFLLAGPVIMFVFGAQYAGSISILQIHIFSAVFIFLQVVLNRWILIENALYFLLFCHGMGVLVNVALNLLLIPQYHGIGSAIASLISFALSTYFALLLFRKTRPMFLMISKSFLLPFRLKSLMKTS